jgi:copper(I)-binding protein
VKPALATSVLLLAFHSAGCEPAEDQPGRAGDMVVLGGFAYAPVGPEAVAYLTIQNQGPAPDTLVSVESPFAGLISLHDSRTTGGQVSMEPVERLDLPPGLVIEMAPGGLHLMLTELRMALPAGKQLPLTLRFARAGPLEIEVPINRYGEPR